MNWKIIKIRITFNASSKLFSLLENNHTRVILFLFFSVLSCYVCARDKKKNWKYSLSYWCSYKKREIKKIAMLIVMKLCLRKYICTRAYRCEKKNLESFQTLYSLENFRNLEKVVEKISRQKEKAKRSDSCRSVFWRDSGWKIIEIQLEILRSYIEIGLNSRKEIPEISRTSTTFNVRR